MRDGGRASNKLWTLDHAWLRRNEGHSVRRIRELTNPIGRFPFAGVQNDE